LGDVGEWKGKGITTGIWPSIPADLRFVISQVIRWNADQTKLLHSYSLKAACGKMISKGTDFITYENDRKWLNSPNVNGFSPRFFVTSSGQTGYAAQTFKDGEMHLQ